MNPIIQPGMHPDADTLTAFAEQLLAADERQQVLAHVAVCNRCREVIFLAQQAATGEPLTASATLNTPAKKPRAWWWGGLRWAWVPVGALAALIGVATVLHLRRVETQNQMARNSAPGSVLPQVAPPPAAQSVPPKPAETNAPQKAKPQIRRDQPSIQEKEEVLDQKGTARQRESTLGTAAQPIVVSPEVAVGSVHGTLTARAKATPYGGPMANEQQNAMQQLNAIQQNALARQNLNQAAQNFERKPTNDRRSIAQAAAPVSGTVPVQAEAAAKPTSLAPSPAPPSQISNELMKAHSFGISPAATAQLKKATTASLPGGAQPLSVAFGAGRTVALDTSGALFLSEDQGRHWQPVRTQWTGRAVLVRNMQDVRDLEAKDKAAALQQAAPPVRFELVNDKLQTWKSLDGKTWTAEPVPDK